MSAAGLCCCRRRRVCPQAYADSGDTASKKGDRIWIAEMYGYSFGAAKSDVWHKWHNDFMLYPSYSPSCERQQQQQQPGPCCACFWWWQGGLGGGGAGLSGVAPLQLLSHI